MVVLLILWRWRLFAVYNEEKANEVQLRRTMSSSVVGRLQPRQRFRLQQRQTQGRGEVFEKELRESNFRGFGEFPVASIVRLFRTANSLRLFNKQSACSLRIFMRIFQFFINII
mgnify:CR=1 FL=1